MGLQVQLNQQMLKQGGFYRYPSNGMDLRGFRSTLSNAMESRVFLQEVDVLQTGMAVNNFEIPEFILENGHIDLCSDISFVECCSRIQLSAALYKVDEPQKPWKVFDSIEKKDTNYLEYNVHQFLAEDMAVQGMCIVVEAEWSSDTEPMGHAVLVEEAAYDSVKYTHIYPKKEDSCVEFGKGSSQRNALEEVQAHDDGVRDEMKQIVVALFREPEDRKDTDYICYFDKDRYGSPYFMVPAQGEIIFQYTKIDPDSVRAVCSVTPTSARHERYVIGLGASGSSYREDGVKVDATDNRINYSMLNKWQQPFQGDGGWKNHEFVYCMTIMYKREGSSNYRSVYIKSEPGIGECIVQENKNWICKIPTVILKWGCLSKDTIIEMADGSKRRISDIRIGDIVSCLDNNVCRVENVWSGFDSIYYVLQTEGGKQIKASESHPFFTEEGWKKASMLQPGDKVWMLEEREKRLDTLVVVESKSEALEVYNLSIGGKGLIANDFICGDFELQNEG